MIKSIAAAVGLSLIAGAASAVSLTTFVIELVDVENIGAFSGTVNSGTLEVTIDQDDPAFTVQQGVPSMGLVNDVTLSMGGATFAASGDQEFFALVQADTSVETVSGLLVPTEAGSFLGSSLTYELNIVFDLNTGFSFDDSFFAAQDPVNTDKIVFARLDLVDGDVPLPASAWMLAAGVAVMARRGRKT